MTVPGLPLEPTPEDMRALGEAALASLVRFLEARGDAPASTSGDIEELVRPFREPPGDPVDPAEVLRLVELGAGKGVDTAHPGFLGYIPGGGLYASAVAALLAFGFNPFVGMWDLSPAFVQIEASVVRWFADLFQYPPGSQGVLTSGGSLANFSAIVAARVSELPEDFLRGTIYTSEHTHHSIRKAAWLAGFPDRNVRLVPTDHDLRMDVDALHRLIDEDRAAGWRPFCVVANAGSTDTGTVDPLEDLVGMAHERRMWIHVDAAYGGFFQLTDRGRRILKGISGADSITLDPHKGLFLPYGTGGLIVRDGARLHDAHAVSGSYMQDRATDEEIPSFTDYSLELSRDFRGLRAWLPLKLHGVAAFRDALDEKLDLAGMFHAELSASAGFEVPWAPDLSTVAFRYVPSVGDPEAFNRALLDRVNASGRVFLSSTRVGGRYVIRVCILSHRTHRDRVEEAIELIRDSAARLEAGT